MKLLTKHAHAVCWGRIADLQNEHGWIVNEAIYRALTYEASFKGQSKFSTWFHRIVYNICSNALKAKLRRGEEIEIDQAIEEGRWIKDDPEENLWLDKVDGRLEGEDKQLFQMLRTGYNYDEIAEKLDSIPVRMRMRWMRLKERIRNGELGE